jgi:hypothetical protein
VLNGNDPEPDLRPLDDPTDEIRDPVSRKVIRATALARAGYISRAAKALSQDGLQPASADVVGKLRALHPESSGTPPPCPVTVPLVGVDNELLTKIICSKLKNGSAPGPWMDWRADYPFGG